MCEAFFHADFDLYFPDSSFESIARARAHFGLLGSYKGPDYHHSLLHSPLLSLHTAVQTILGGCDEACRYTAGGTSTKHECNGGY